MSGYEWHPKIKCVPDNGAEVEYDLRTVLTDASGPVQTELEYIDESDERDDVNLGLRRVERGFRPAVRFVCDVASMGDHATMALIVTRLIRADWTCYVSLDNGTTYRECVLEDWRGPRGFRNKTVGGATFELALRCVDVLDELPSMSTGVSSW